MVKKIILIITLIIIMFSNLNAVNLGSNVQIVPSNISPSSVKPGNDLTLKFNIINSGDSVAKSVSIDLKKNKVFSFKDSDLIKNNFDLCSSCSYDATYYFSVNSGIKSGIYPITFNINHDNNRITTQTINVKVEGVPEILIIGDNFNNTKLYPSEKFDLKIKIKNFGTSLAKNIKVSSNFNSIMSIGNNVIYLSELKINSNKEIINKFKIDENLMPGLYKVPFIIEFEDEFGNIFYKNYTIGVEILNKAKINIQYLKLNNYEINLFDYVEINGMLENVGYGKAENIYVESKTILEGFKKSFVGSLNKNEDSPIQFKFKANKVGIQNITLNIYYLDDFGKHNFSENIKINITKPTSKLYTILGILLLLVLFISLKVIKSKKNKN